jgi:hypothetical protein
MSDQPEIENRTVRFHLIGGAVMELEMEIAEAEKASDDLRGGSAIKMLAPSGQITILWPHGVAGIVIEPPK